MFVALLDHIRQLIRNRRHMRHRIVLSDSDGPDLDWDDIEVISANPSHHYTTSAYDEFRVIEVWRLNFAVGRAVEHIYHSRLLGGQEAIYELSQSIRFLQIEIDNIRSRKRKH